MVFVQVFQRVCFHVVFLKEVFLGFFLACGV